MRLLFRALLLLLVAISGVVGYYFPREPQVEYVEIIKEVPVEVVTKLVVPQPYFVIQNVPVYVDRVKEVEVEKEVTKWRYMPYRPWDSVKQFKEWYQEQHYESSILLGDCDDYALRLQIDGHEQGRPISQALTWNGIYYGNRVSDAPGGHAGNLILVHENGGGVYYFVEPQATKVKVTRVISAD